jgi:hypothetical protein
MIDEKYVRCEDLAKRFSRLSKQEIALWCVEYVSDLEAQLATLREENERLRADNKEYLDGAEVDNETMGLLLEENERLKNEVAHDLGFTGCIDEINNEEKTVYVLIEDRYELDLPLELFKNPFEGQFIEFRQITRKWTEEEIERAKKRGKELHEFFDQIPRSEGCDGR